MRAIVLIPVAEIWVNRCRDVGCNIEPGVDGYE